MTNINNVADILNQIPVILEYFVPGFIFICSFNFFTTKENSSYQIVISVVISYILKAIFSFAHQFIFPKRIFLWSEKVIILTLAAFLLSLFIAWIFEKKFFNRFPINLLHKSVHDDIWRDAIDYENGTTLRFVSGENVYTGILDRHEEKGNDSWFLLSNYIIEEDGKIYDSEQALKETDMESKMAINLKNVDYVQLYYSKKDKSKQKASQK